MTDRYSVIRWLMVNVVVLQGAAVPESSSVFYLQIGGETFSGSKDAKVLVSGAVAEYVGRTIKAGLLCFVKGSYVPSGNYVEAETVAFMRDKLETGGVMWDYREANGSSG